MMLRTLLTIANLAAIIAAIVVLLALPGLDGPAFYLLVGWMFGSMILVYGPWGSRQVGAPRPRPAAADGAPLTSAPVAPSFASAPPADLGFCIYCAAPLPAGAPVCPTCGHRAPRI